MTSKRFAVHGMQDRLVPRFPTAQASQATNCAEPAAPAVSSSPAGAVFRHFTETSRVGAHGKDDAALAVDASSASAAFTICLSPAVALILKLATDAAGVDRDELIARAICVYADRIGIPSLARPAADDIGDDLTDVPEFVRRDQMRFSRAREALGNKTRGVLK
jgi:hypothetical protein